MEYQSGRKSIPAGRLYRFFLRKRTYQPDTESGGRYEMSNGKRIDENGSTYDAANPYKDRDPRLAQTIFYQGMMWGRADKEERRAIDVRYNSMRTKEWITPQPWEAPPHRILSEKVRE